LPARGFGVRIEDEVLMTDKGYRLLSENIPRKLEDVEAWVARERWAATVPRRWSGPNLGRPAHKGLGSAR
jgi:hypothetical protein